MDEGTPRPSISVESVDVVTKKSPGKMSVKVKTQATRTSSSPQLRLRSSTNLSSPKTPLEGCLNFCTYLADFDSTTSDEDNHPVYESYFLTK